MLRNYFNSKTTNQITLNHNLLKGIIHIERKSCKKFILLMIFKSFEYGRLQQWHEKLDYFSCLWTELTISGNVITPNRFGQESSFLYSLERLSSAIGSMGIMSADVMSSVLSTHSA